MAGTRRATLEFIGKSLRFAWTTGPARAAYTPRTAALPGIAWIAGTGTNCAAAATTRARDARATSRREAARAWGRAVEKACALHHVEAPARTSTHSPKE